MSKNLIKFLLSEPQEIQNILLHHKTLQCQFKRKKSDSDSEKNENNLENQEQRHAEEQCSYYHTENDRRRVPYVENFQNLDDKDDCQQIFAYSSKQCEEYQCNDFKQCQDCNNISEHKFHPLNYKTGKQCKNAQNCQFQNRLFCPDLHENETPRILPNKKKMSDQSQNSEALQNQIIVAEDDQKNSQETIKTQQSEKQDENQQCGKQIQLDQNEIELNTNQFQNFQNKNKSLEQTSQSSGGSYFPFPPKNTGMTNIKANNNPNTFNQHAQNFIPQINKIGGNFDIQQQQQQFQQQPQFQQKNFQQQQQQKQQFSNNPTNNSINQQTKMLQQQQQYQQQHVQQQQQQLSKGQKGLNSNLQQQQQGPQAPILGLGRPNSLKQSPFVDLDTFKTEACQSQEQNHNPKNCIYYHNNCDRRRSPKDFNYSFNICPNRCMKDECPYSHNKVEQLYHRCRYKSKFCKSYGGRSNGKCEYGIYCSFAHYDQEISIKLINKMEHNDVFNIWYYKTVWCPYTTNHDRGQCPYAHNVQDFRRDPACFEIEPEDCPNWIKADNVSLYNDGGCPNLLNCNKCHGWKEQEYHPKVYKTKKCTNQKNCKKKDCAYYHSEADRNTKDENYMPARQPKGSNDFQELKIYQGMPLDLFKDNNILNKQNQKNNVLFGNNQNNFKYIQNSKNKDRGQMNPAQNIYYEKNTFANHQQINMQQMPKQYMTNQMQEYQMGPMNRMWQDDSPTNTTGPNSLCPSNISYNFSRDNSNDSNQQKSHQTNYSIRTIKTNFNQYYQKCNYNSDGEIDPQQMKNPKNGMKQKKMRYGNNDFYPKNNNNNPLYIQPKIKNNRQQILDNNINNKEFSNFQDIKMDNISLNNANNVNQKNSGNGNVNSYFYNKGNVKRALSPQELQMNDQNFYDQQFGANYFQMMNNNNNQQNMYGFNNSNDFSNFNFQPSNNANFQQMNSNNNNQQFVGSMNNNNNDGCNNFNNNGFVDLNFGNNNNYNNQDMFDQDSAQDFNYFHSMFQNMNLQDNNQFQAENSNYQQGNFNALNFNNSKNIESNFHKNSGNFSNNGLQGQNFHSDDESSNIQHNNNTNNTNNNNTLFDSQPQNQHFTLFQQRDMYNNIK